MQRIFTDPRFPGIQIENHGTFKFFVVEKGKITATFIAKEDLRDPQVSAEFAQRRAEAYFDRMGRMDMSGELEAQWAQTGPSVDAKANPQEVERALAAARAEQNPERRRALEKRALSLMAREESLVEQVVNCLLHEC